MSGRTEPPMRKACWSSVPAICRGRRRNCRRKSRVPVSARTCSPCRNRPCAICPCRKAKAPRIPQNDFARRPKITSARRRRRSRGDSRQGSCRRNHGRNSRQKIRNRKAGGSQSRAKRKPRKRLLKKLTPEKPAEPKAGTGNQNHRHSRRPGPNPRAKPSPSPSPPRRSSAITSCRRWIFSSTRT